MPAEGKQVVTGKELATIETIVIDLEVPAPFDGEVAAANEALQDSPELINQDPY